MSFTKKLTNTNGYNFHTLLLLIILLDSDYIQKMSDNYSIHCQLIEFTRFTCGTFIVNAPSLFDLIEKIKFEYVPPKIKFPLHDSIFVPLLKNCTFFAMPYGNESELYFLFRKYCMIEYLKKYQKDEKKMSDDDIMEVFMETVWEKLLVKRFEFISDCILNMSTSYPYFNDVSEKKEWLENVYSSLELYKDNHKIQNHLNTILAELKKFE